MDVPSSHDILSISPESVPRFIRQHASDRRLRQIMTRLNADLLSQDPEARDLAQKAIERLGFPLFA